MKKFLVKRLTNFILKMVVRQLTEVKVRKRVISLINKKIDIPRLNEAQEQKLFEAIYDVVEELLLTM